MPETTRPPFEQIVLLLQGGGALGAYQAGVYEALAEAGLHPDWVAGISIGAINAALIAGNPPEARVGKLRTFWETVTASPWPTPPPFGAYLPLPGDFARGLFNQFSAGMAAAAGQPAFFRPRTPPPWLAPDGSAGATSYYDTSPLRATLERLVDFDRVNASETRLSIGAVNVRSGDFISFEPATHRIGPQHVMASGALPPAFPAIEIDGELYWDGGLVSNTPLQWVLDQEPQHDTLAFQVDLWNARGQAPGNLAEVVTRQKEIQYSSRTRASTDRFRQTQALRNAVRALVGKLPADLGDDPQLDLLRGYASDKVYNIVHLIYRARRYEGGSKDFEFSRLSMEEHWKAGHDDTVASLRDPQVLQRPGPMQWVSTFDVTPGGSGRKDAGSA